MKGLFLFALCLACSAQNPSTESSGSSVRILGWYSLDGRWVKSECPPEKTFAAHSTFVGCEAGQHATACESNRIMYSGGSTSDCDLDRCETATVFESRGGEASSAFLCYATAAFRPEPRTFYRNTFDFAVSTPTTTTTTTGSTDAEKTSGSTSGTSGASAGITSHTSSGPASTSAGTSGGTATGTQPTSSAAGTPTVALAGGRAVLWAGVTTLLMMGLGAVMFI